MTPTVVDAARDAVKERLEPALESLEDRMRTARRSVTQGRHAVEDFAMSTALHVRRRPLASIALAGAVGALAGCLVGFLMAHRAQGRER